jgi:maltose alpha-D-glucosyltransferase/alpha-amylase
MQWDDGVNAGFGNSSKDKLYIPQDPALDRPTVKAQMADAGSLYHEIKKLIEVRQAHAALQSKGEIEFVYVAENAYPFAYVRSSEDEKILVVINPSGQDAEFASELQLGEVVYSYGKEAYAEGGKVVAPAASVSFIKLN